MNHDNKTTFTPITDCRRLLAGDLIILPAGTPGKKPAWCISPTGYRAWELKVQTGNRERSWYAENPESKIKNLLSDYHCAPKIFYVDRTRISSPSKYIDSKVIAYMGNDTRTLVPPISEAWLVPLPTKTNLCNNKLEETPDIINYYLSSFCKDTTVSLLSELNLTGELLFDRHDVDYFTNITCTEKSLYEVDDGSQYPRLEDTCSKDLSKTLDRTDIESLLKSRIFDHTNPRLYFEIDAPVKFLQTLVKKGGIVYRPNKLFHTKLAASLLEDVISRFLESLSKIDEVVTWGIQNLQASAARVKKRKRCLSQISKQLHKKSGNFRMPST